VTDRVAAVAQIMDEFGERTGLTTTVEPRRYLWTDAFAVCNYLALHRHTGESRWLDRARALIEQVHEVLGRHRPDDAREGWISGLPQAEGRRHPTAGGLRIGKLLPERGPAQVSNEKLDWDRDGQYYHYLTRWMHALERAADATGDAGLLRYGVELAGAAHAGFMHVVLGEKRLYWKMSIDLSHPVVMSMGRHDALDGLAAAAALEAHVRSGAGPVDGADVADLQVVLSDLAEMCAGRGWATHDALGIGGLLTDAWFLARLRSTDVPDRLLTGVLRDAARSLDLVTMGRHLDARAAERLAFRELGLSLGLAAVERLDQMRSATELPESAREAVDNLLRHVPLRARLEAFWQDPAHQAVQTWTEHKDINAVMLATSLLPHGYLGTATDA
jgi:hypothetical protein